MRALYESSVGLPTSVKSEPRISDGVAVALDGGEPGHDVGERAIRIGVHALVA